jgi:hypothetical protein
VTNDNATTQLAALIAQRHKAQRRVDELSAEQRRAVEEREAARLTLVEFERGGGGRRAERTQLEQALADAEARLSERWPERIEGARAAVRDAQAAVTRFVGEHLDELVADRERDGEVVAGKLTELAEALLAVYAERERIAQEISSLVSTVTNVRPGDVSFTRAEALANEAQKLIQRGGEAPPALRRERMPQLEPVA